MVRYLLKVEDVGQGEGVEVGGGGVVCPCRVVKRMFLLWYVHRGTKFHGGLV